MAKQPSIELPKIDLLDVALSSLTENSPELQKPVDIITFAESELYCGIKLFKRQKLILKAFYVEDFTEEEKADIDLLINEGKIPKDFWEKYYWHRENGTVFNEILLIIGRRGSKSTLASLIAVYEAYKLLLIPDPVEYFGLVKGTKINIINVANNEEQAVEILFDKIKSLILRNPFFTDKILPEKVMSSEIYLMTEHDKKVLEELKHRKIKRFEPTLVIRAGPATSAGIRGHAAIVVIFDEMAFYEVDKGAKFGKELYDALIPSVKQFKEHGKIIGISSPYLESGIFYDTYVNIQTKNLRGMLFFQLATWEINENILFEDLKDELEKDPDYFWREFGAKFGSVSNRFLPPEKVDAIFDNNLFLRDIGIDDYYYHGHADPAKSNAGFAIAIGHREYDSNIQKYVIVIDHMKVFWADEFPGGVIDYSVVEDYIVWLCQRFDIREFSFDQWNSVGSIQRIQKKLRELRINHTKITERTFTDKSNYIRYSQFKVAVLAGQVRAPYFRQLFLELSHLQEENGKVTKPTSGAVQTKDLADCVAEVTRRLLEDINPIEVEKRKKLPLPRLVSKRY